jgi:cell division protein FtsB
MEMIPYGKRLHAAARTDFKRFWSDYRWWITIVGFFNLPLVIQVVLGKHTMVDFGVACIYAVISLIFSLLGSYVIAMRRGAESLDTHWQQRIGQRNEQLDTERERVKNLNAEIEDLKKKPGRSIPDERDFNAVKSLLEKHQEDDKTVLGFLLKVGKMKQSHGWNLAPLPKGFTHDRTQIALNKLAQDDLVIRENTNIPGGWELVWQVAPWAIQHLRELL